MDNGNQILHVCAEFGRVEIFKWLVERYNANTMSKNYYGETPFHVAAKENKLDIIKLYNKIYKNINDFRIDHKANDGCSATMFACLNSHISIIKYLIREMGAD